MSEWLSDGVLLIGPDPQGTVAAIAIDLPVEPAAVTVVSLLTSVRDRRWLTDAVASAVPPGATVRLAISNAGAPEGDGPPPAQRLAERLGVDVIAPDSRVLLTPGGSAFVVPPATTAATPTAATTAAATAAAGQWLRFGADGSVEPAGARFPAPSWAPAVTEVARERVTGVTVLEVPAGLWVRPAEEGTAPPLDDLAYCVPADPDLCTLIVGAAGTARLDPGVVVEAVAGLPPAVQGRLLVAPYGSGTRIAAAVAGALARRWGRPVHLANGVPMIGSDGVRRTLATDEDGAPLWWPLSRQLRCDPDGPPVPVDPAGALADLPVVTDRVWSLRGPWVVELTHFGLWVRPGDAPAGAGQLAQIPWDPRWLTVVAGAPGQPSDGVRTALAELLARLPEQARTRMRTVSPELLSRLTSGKR
ncbi:hypothetical protein AB0H83_41855 [Dactylosporangium sp. NPDC050688]|uniref:hypothetical protein n=1 Tax=Dactylosporangium sp. NPDC050688 TaxID=3157217 RepID=UPI0033ECBCA1